VGHATTSVSEQVVSSASSTQVGKSAHAVYDLDACPLLKSDFSSLDFAVNRFFMKLFRTSSIDVVKQCQYTISVFLYLVFYRLNVHRNLKRNFMRAITCYVK